MPGCSVRRLARGLWVDAHGCLLTRLPLETFVDNLMYIFNLHISSQYIMPRSLIYFFKARGKLFLLVLAKYTILSRLMCGFTYYSFTYI